MLIARLPLYLSAVESANICYAAPSHPATSAVFVSERTRDFPIHPRSAAKATFVCSCRRAQTPIRSAAKWVPPPVTHLALECAGEFAPSSSVTMLTSDSAQRPSLRSPTDAQPGQRQLPGNTRRHPGRCALIAKPVQGAVDKPQRSKVKSHPAKASGVPQWELA